MSSPARFSRRAGREVAEALRAMEHDNARQAMRVAVVAAARRLGANPYLGRLAQAPLPARYRFWSLPRFGYLLVNDPQTDPVVILRCVHTKRDLPRALADLRGLPEL